MSPDRDSDMMHMLVAAAMMLPIFAFYAIIAMEFFGYRESPERMAYVSPSSLAKICSAFATDKAY